MNKKYNQYVPFVAIGAVIIAVLIISLCMKDLFSEFTEAKSNISSYERQVQEKEKQIAAIDAASEEEKIKLKALKPIYETNIPSSGENLSVFGDMFELVVKKAQSNGLMIRSIEYDMTPENDPLLKEHASLYNACELKFLFVGTYSQLQAYLADINSSFPYLTYISKLSVSAFSKNTDYLLIKTSITLYSRKPDNSSLKTSSKGFMGR